MDFLKPFRSLLDLRSWRYQPTSEMNKLMGVLDSGLLTKSGITVNDETAMRAATVYGCVRVLSEDVSSLPFTLYKKLKGDDREVADSHPLHALLHDLPNEQYTSVELLSFMMQSVLLRGAAYARVIRSGDNVVRELRYMDASRVRVLPARTADELPAFEYQDEAGKKELLTWDQVWKVYGPFGRSVLGHMRETIGRELAQGDYASRFFSSYAAPRGVIQFKGNLGQDEEAIKRWKEKFERTYAGSENSWGVALLENGAEFKPISVSMADAEFCESEKLTARQIYGGFRVPGYKLGYMDGSIKSNIEQQSRDYLNDSLTHWLVKLQQSVYRDLLSTSERGTYYAEFNTAALLRGDLLSRYQAYGYGRQNGFLSINDIRRRENDNGIGDDGDKYLVQAGYIPVDMLESYLMQQANKKPAETKTNVSILNEAPGTVEKLIETWRDEKGQLHAKVKEVPSEKLNGHAHL
jgi:HK97 family phage portal protein